MKMTKKEYELWLSEVGCPEDDKQSNGGRVPDACKYGKWVRKHDPIMFAVGYREAVRAEGSTS
jgi:hypothetical protein